MKKRFKINLFLLLILISFIGIGYSYLNQTLSINGHLSIDASKLKSKDANSVLDDIGTEYTGPTDEIDSSPIIINTSDGTHDNVSFGGFCWKIIRTTETGGTKLLYNGVVSSTGTCENTGTDTQIGISQFNSGHTSPAYVGYMYNTIYDVTAKEMSSDTGTYVFGNDISYSSSTNKYTLKATNASNITIKGVNWSTSYNTLDNNHYTCLSTSTSCSTVYYVNYTKATMMYYFSFTGGKTVEDALDEMVGSNGTDVNVKDSTIKTLIDNWYAANLDSYSDYLEDTIFCNDRATIYLNGWNPNGGSTTGQLLMNSFDSSFTDLSCSNNNDKFTVSTSIGNGKLKYKVGLMTFPEAVQMSSSSSNSGERYWLMSPYGFGAYYAHNRIIYSDGSNDTSFTSTSNGVRPVVSLNSSVKFVAGTEGTSTNPYVVKTN